MKKLVVAALIIYSSSAWSQEPTIIYGASKTAPDVSDEFTVTQPENAENPLGNPIVVPFNSAADTSTQTMPDQTQPQTAPLPDQTPSRIINQKAPQNPAPFSINPQQEKSQIENTLYEGGDRIYDVQSYPLKDINTITEPNIDPTITTYPEY